MIPEEPKDNRVRVPLNGKVVVLDQLNRETGGYGLCGSATEVVAVEGSPLTVEELTAAVAAHVPIQPPTVGEQVDALPDPTVDLEGFKVGLKSVLGVA